MDEVWRPDSISDRRWDGAKKPGLAQVRITARLVRHPMRGPGFEESHRSTVVSSDDETVTLEISPGVQSKFLKQAIVRVVTPPEPHEEIDPDSTEQSPPPV